MMQIKMNLESPKFSKNKFLLKIKPARATQFKELKSRPVSYEVPGLTTIAIRENIHLNSTGSHVQNHGMNMNLRRQVSLIKVEGRHTGLKH
ncbi:hypothetical protein XELAEV_18021621mg [Xenopus laevis]|uniref:Uncharacterized protein n=1 Tax=Xenopus laevis TaxID=8355 RepID=A0A974HS06_XENLA|nr:hypothetical protein XELAEV_18021621mg [Xenopus laevis]